jgi:hypothetical protein
VIAGEDGERTEVRTSRLRLVVAAQPIRDHRTLVIARRIGQSDHGFGSIGHGVPPRRSSTRPTGAVPADQAEQ